MTIFEIAGAINSTVNEYFVDLDHAAKAYIYRLDIDKPMLPEYRVGEIEMTPGGDIRVRMGDEEVVFVTDEDVYNWIISQ